MSIFASHSFYRPELEGPLLRGEAKVNDLMESGVRRRLRSGANLIDANTEHPYVYRLINGWAGRVRTLPDGRSQFILMFLPGDLFAIKSMFVNRNPDAVQCIGDVVVEQIDHRKLKAAFDSDPDIAMRCTWQVIEEERRLHNSVASLGQGSADERMALMLIDFRGRLALQGGAGPDLTEFYFPMTQEQVAEYIGVSAVHVNRVLRTFRENNIATIRGKQARILDVQALTAVARPMLDWLELHSLEHVGEPSLESQSSSAPGQ